MTLRIFIPGVNTLSYGVHQQQYVPFFFTERSGQRFNVTDLKSPQDVTRIAGARTMTIGTQYHLQPVLVITEEGGYLLQAAKLNNSTDPGRVRHRLIVKGDVSAVRSNIFGIYPLHTMVKWETPADEIFIRCLMSLVHSRSDLGDY